MKSRLRREGVLGPTLYVASPPFRYSSTLDADSVDAAITEVAREGWDLLRVSESLSLEVWDLLAERMQDYAVGFGGPVPDSVGLQHALATGVTTVDHLDGLVEAATSEAYRERIRSWYGRGTGAPADSARPSDTQAAQSRPPPPPPLDSLAATLSVRRARAVAGKARASGTWMIPALSWWEKRQGPHRPEELAEAPEMRYVPPSLRDRWILEKRGLPYVDSLTAAHLARARMATTKALSDVAGGLLLGTDAPALFNVPGFSVHREMRLMREAGMTPYEVLIAATRSVARYAATELGESGRFGTVEPGNRADLVLVTGNPLEDLEPLRAPDGVMVKGRWLTRAEIDARLSAIAGRWEAPDAPGAAGRPGQ